MKTVEFSLAGETLTALGSGALWWGAHNLLCVSDLHLGKSERILRKGGGHLPPYDVQDTLIRLENDLRQTGAENVVCLGDSFDDLAAADALPEQATDWILRLQAGRRWVWIEGNHDPGPLDLPGSHLAELLTPPLTFRHIAQPGQSGEISGHYHPKISVQTRLRRISRPAFLFDSDRVILPAYGTYTGGLRSSDPALAGLMRRTAYAITTGQTPRMISLSQTAT
ncbi:ligase-associated DNA damage response endonuclease PdeM [Cognatishimia sp. SS12]|uniref:ligase-associated DNA damage response endonuclease PdeM n=1 Tax=Cognatishimia sp. SS12 TaxID=2979465 RepID=UPI00232FFCC4|nr:ligase-associated DNA damage response endonuclease PdeM [Cognatishimia sp. SS12]MDC0738771.1 ligase-associated DNA damage response endonuclease PdeM [Cognatishimia sp. SS12]